MKNLRIIRKKKGYTQSEVAEILGVDQGTYSRFETGDRKLDSDNITKLSHLFDVTSDYLLGLTDTPYTLDEADLLKDIKNNKKEVDLFDEYDFIDDDGNPVSPEEVKKLLKIIRALDK